MVIVYNYKELRNDLLSDRSFMIFIYLKSKNQITKKKEKKKTINDEPDIDIVLCILFSLSVHPLVIYVTFVIDLKYTSAMFTNTNRL